MAIWLQIGLNSDLTEPLHFFLHLLELEKFCASCQEPLSKGDAAGKCGEVSLLSVEN